MSTPLPNKAKNNPLPHAIKSLNQFQFLQYLPSPYVTVFPFFSNLQNQKKPCKISMKLIWSPDLASKAYIDTINRQKSRESGVPELLSAMAAGWNCKLIVESWSHGGAIGTSVGLAVSAAHTSGRHVCLVPDERSRSGYIEAMREAGISAVDVVVGDEGESVAEFDGGVDFMVVDSNSKIKDFARVLRGARLSRKGAVLALKNASERGNSGFRWDWVLGRKTRVVKTVFLPVGKGLDIVHVGANGADAASKKDPSRWIMQIDRKSGEEHVFRG